jgi:hypothetical protein
VKGDPAERALRSLHGERWLQQGHEAALLAQLQLLQHPSTAKPSRRWPLLAAGILIGVIATAATVTAADGWRWLARLLGVQVVDLERQGDAIHRLTLEDEQGHRVVLQPIADAPEQVIAVDREGGGTLRLRVVKEGDTGLVPAFAAVDQRQAPAVGQHLQLRRVSPEHFVAGVHGDVLQLTSSPADGAAGRTFVLRAVAGQPQRFTDGNAVLEIVE